jgi:hypothetical protein
MTANLNPRSRRIPPRAEDLVRYINGVIVQNLRSRNTDDIVLNLPDIVGLAFKVVNETGTITVHDYGMDVMFVPRQ